jgi:large subunit ribosomal protein L31
MGGPRAGQAATAGAVPALAPDLRAHPPVGVGPASRLEYEMKQEIHPEYVPAHVRCTCGNEFWTRSTKPELHVEICSNCHPFYTGRQKLVDTGGRVERFRRRAARRR